MCSPTLKTGKRKIVLQKYIVKHEQYSQESAQPRWLISRILSKRVWEFVSYFPHLVICLLFSTSGNLSLIFHTQHDGITLLSPAPRWPNVHRMYCW